MEDKGKVPFRVMFLFGAGFSIAAAFSSSGLANEVTSYLLALTNLPAIFVFISIAILVTFTTEIISNTALIFVMLPIIYTLSIQANMDTELFFVVIIAKFFWR
ncbi:SLC13 family permease [Sulfurimonas sp.]|uniref:SLC13 family permease n=1 Tax=Sulfurimonas sp. TaxID=2022749 RepID=UPI0025D03EF3|nr:SLC13 family permease [Sulfurimonas sp.]